MAAKKRRREGRPTGPTTAATAAAALPTRRSTRLFLGPPPPGNDMGVKEDEKEQHYDKDYEDYADEDDKDEDNDDDEVDESSEGGVPCAAPSDKEVEGSSKRGEPCAATTDVMNADIMIDPPMSNLNVGSRVLVDYKGTLYNATIRKHCVKSGKQEFQIHYDGNKKSTLY